MTFPRAPETEEEREAVDDCRCDEEGSGENYGWFCTRLRNHAGSHIAANTDGLICAVWDSK